LTYNRVTVVLNEKISSYFTFMDSLHALHSTLMRFW